MEEKMEMLEIERSIRGTPRICEKGGGFTNTGSAQIIAGPNGERLKPKAVGPGFACGTHAEFEAFPGMLVIQAGQWRGDYEISVYRIVEITGNWAKAQLIHRFERGEWNVDPPETLREAIEAAKKKARCYHCRRPHYILP